jgi:hypothetical protein
MKDDKYPIDEDEKSRKRLRGLRIDYDKYHI